MLVTLKMLSESRCVCAQLHATFAEEDKFHGKKNSVAMCSLQSDLRFESKHLLAFEKQLKGRVNELTEVKNKRDQVVAQLKKLLIASQCVPDFS